MNKRQHKKAFKKLLQKLKDNPLLVYSRKDVEWKSLKDRIYEIAELETLKIFRDVMIHGIGYHKCGKHVPFESVVDVVGLKSIAFDMPYESIMDDVPDRFKGIDPDSITHYSYRSTPVREGKSLIERLLEDTKMLEATTPPPRNWFSLGRHPVDKPKLVINRKMADNDPDLAANENIIISDALTDEDQ